jgi:hypothetical protein
MGRFSQTTLWDSSWPSGVGVLCLSGKAADPLDMGSLLKALRDDQLASEGRMVQAFSSSCSSLKTELGERFDVQERRINAIADNGSLVSSRLDRMESELQELRSARNLAHHAADIPVPNGPAGPGALPPHLPRAAPVPAPQTSNAEANAFEVEGISWRDRKVGILGGFPRDTEDDIILHQLELFSAHWKCDLVAGGVRVPFALGSMGKLVFKEARLLRMVVARNKENPFSFNSTPLWFGVAKSYDERIRDRVLRSAKDSVSYFMGQLEPSDRTRIRTCFGSYSVVAGKEILCKWNEGRAELEWLPQAIERSPLKASAADLQSKALSL